MHPKDRAGGRELLKGFVADLGGSGLGTIEEKEIFDADPPYTPARLHGPGLEGAGDELGLWAMSFAPKVKLGRVPQTMP